MKKKDYEVVDIYEGKISMEDRLMLLLTGVFCFPVAFALFFYFENKQEFKYHAHFARIGGWTGFMLLLLILAFCLLFNLAFN